MEVVGVRVEGTMSLYHRLPPPVLPAVAAEGRWQVREFVAGASRGGPASVPAPPGFSPAPGASLRNRTQQHRRKYLGDT